MRRMLADSWAFCARADLPPDIATMSPVMNHS